MNLLQGYNIILVMFIVGTILSYMENKDDPDKGLGSHIKLGMLLAFIAGIVVFFNSQEGFELLNNTVSSISPGNNQMGGNNPGLSDLMEGPPNF